MAGGGGWGDPLKRLPRAVLDDVLDGRVSTEAARDLYGVILKANNQEVDQNATRKLRSEMSST